MAGVIPHAQRTALAAQLALTVLDVQSSVDAEEPDEFLGLEVRPMADGSGDWAILVGVVDAEGVERTFRTRVSADGSFDSEELN